MAAGTLTYDQVLLQLKQQQYKPIYFLYGDEPYYIDKVTDKYASTYSTKPAKPSTRSSSTAAI